MVYWYFQSVPLTNIFYRTIKQIPKFFSTAIIYTKKRLLSRV